MITAHDSSQDRIKAFKNGVDYFVSKPFTIEHIVSLVESISKKED
jgi:DNA-binding response OmpR family regulator